MFNETATRMVPNILKNNSKLNRKIFSQLNEIDSNSTFSNQTNIQIPSFSIGITNSSSQENKCFKNEIKDKRSSRRRKQGFSFADVWHEFPNCNVCSVVDAEDTLSRKNQFTSINSSTSIKQRQSKDTQNEKNNVSILKTKQEVNLSPNVSQNVSTDFTSECYSLSYLQDMESNDQDSIDFSSNEIFSKLNYEIYNANSLSSFTEYMTDCNETHNSLSTTYDSDANEKEYDLNGNEIEAHKEAYESVVSLEHIHSKYVSLVDNEEVNWPFESCCNYCFENCVSSWIATTKAKNDMIEQDKALTPMVNQNTSPISSKINLNSSDLCSIHLANNSRSISSSINDTDSTNEVLTELTGYYEEYNVTEEMLQKTIAFDKKTEHNIHNGFDDVLLLKTDFNTTVRASRKQSKDEYPTDVPSVEQNLEYNSNNEEYQCSICSLTFSSARTMAMHQGGAHGGMYVLLCETCGRLFNRKYQYNRHLIHCGRLKEPFGCDMCLKTYKHKSSLVHHLRETHQVHYVRRHATTFTCNVCNKMYSKFGAFENHVKKHQNTPSKFLSYCNDL